MVRMKEINISMPMLFFFILVFSSGIYVNAAEISEEEYFQLNSARTQYDQLRLALENMESTNSIMASQNLKDLYGGSFIDSFYQLHVLLVKSDADTIHFLHALLGENVVIDITKYSDKDYSETMDLLNQTFDLMATEDKDSYDYYQEHMSSFYVDYKDQCVKIIMKKKDSSFPERFQAEVFSGDIIQFIDCKDLNHSVEGELAGGNDPVKAPAASYIYLGVAIYDTSLSKQTCTGYRAIKWVSGSSVTGYVSCQHGKGLNHSIRYASSSGIVMGTVYSQSTSNDCAFIKYTGTYTTSNKVNGTNVALSGARVCAQGDLVCFKGNNTSFTNKAIASTNASYLNSYGSVSNCYSVSQTTVDGDSGGILYYKYSSTSGGVVGILGAGSTGNSIYVKESTIYSSLGVSPY